MRQNAKNRLTNAAMRYRIRRRTDWFVMVKINYNGRHIECETPQEAIEILRHITREGIVHLRDSMIPDVWSNRVFWKFIESLGDSQKQVLALLLKRRKVSDADIRQALNLESNKQLAGVLSGIS